MPQILPIQPNSKRHYDVTTADLPLACPMPHMRLWDSHPRIYLPIQDMGEVTCPYCEAHYRLVHPAIET